MDTSNSTINPLYQSSSEKKIVKDEENNIENIESNFKLLKKRKFGQKQSDNTSARKCQKIIESDD